MAHGAEVVNLVGLHLLDDADQVAAIGEVAVVQHKVACRHMGVLVQVVNAVGVEAGGATFDAMNLVAFFEQEFCQIRAVLPRYACDECYFSHSIFLMFKVLILEPVNGLNSCRNFACALHARSMHG